MGGGTHNTTSDSPSIELSMSDLLSVKTNKEKSNEIRKNLSSMSKEKQSEIFNKYASASLYDYWTSQTLGGGPDVVDVHVNGTYYSDVAGFDYIIGDDGKTYYCLNEKYRYDEEGNIVEKKNAFDYEDFYDNCWRVLSINN